ncbi:MAG TPA: NINE protein [Kamptonema sp.]|nr:NINE protein [Kamptonema sp.]
MKDKSVAILLTFFLGAIGIHKFYLGYNLAGLLYLLFSWTFIPAIIAFFDFIGLILMSDQAFHAKYNGGTLPAGTHARSAKDITAALGDLKKLYEGGAITAEEYEEKRQKLLKDL